MKNRINITLALVFFLYSGGYSAEPPAEDSGAEQPVTEVTVPQTQPLLDPAVTQSGPAQQGAVQTGRDRETVFRLNIHSNPVLSGTAFLEIISKEEPAKVRMFLSRNQYRIFSLLIELQRTDPGTTYPQVVRGLERYNIGIGPWPGLDGGEGHRDRHDPNSRRGEGRDRRDEPGNGGQEEERVMPPPRPIDENPINKMLEIRSDMNAGGDQKKLEEKITSLGSEYPEDSSVQTGVAEFLNEMKNYEESEKYSTKAVDLDETNSDAYKMRAVSKYSMNDIKGAVEDIKKATELDPQDETSRLLTAIINSKRTVSINNLSSVQDLKNALKDLKNDEPPAIYLGKSDSWEKVNGAAASKGVDYNKSKFYLKTAATKNQMQDYEGGLKYATLAIEKNPGNLDAYLERANSRNFLGHYDEAIRDASAVIEKEPSNISALNMRAWSLYKKGQFDEAGEDSTRALEIKPDFADAMFSRSLVYEKQGKYEEMLKDLERAAALSPLYRARFRDAVAQYANKAPNFSRNFQSVRQERKRRAAAENQKTDYKRFLTILLFTVTGGLLIGLGLLHIFSDKKTRTESKITHPDILSPSVFYEGVATGKYKVLKKIGQGGMGIVYQAVDQTLNREVAIKKMNDEIKLNEREKQRFIEEARTVAMLRHPNIIEIYTIFEEGEDIYLVFEYIDGITLDRKLNKEIRMPFYEAKELVNEIGKALAYAHGKNIIHRDMKLSNVMISKEGFVKVMDFGLAKIARETMARVSSAEVVGSPAYMAPEQDTGVSLKESDLYSLGVCLYEMLTGALPFNGPDYHYQKEKKAFQPLSGSVPGVPREIDALMSRILDPDPQNRYPSPEDFLADLNKLS